MMIRPADYIQTKDKSIHIVNYVMGSIILGTEIYRLIPDVKKHSYETSIKFKPSTNEHYEKYVQRDKDNFRKIKRKDVLTYFSARKAYQENRSKLKGIWRDFDNFFHSLRVNDIGIYGSVMIGFDTHTDVDFVIFGSKSRDIIHDNISKLHKRYSTDPIYKETIKSRLKVARKYYHRKNSFEKIFPRQWSTIEVGNKVHSTLHFVKLRTSKFNPLNKNLENKTISGIAKQVKNFDFWPKTAKLEALNGTYSIFSTFWPYQSALVENEKIAIRGAVDEKEKVIYIIDRDKHYIQI